MSVVTEILLLFYIPQQQDWGHIRCRNRPRNVIGRIKNQDKAMKN